MAQKLLHKRSIKQGIPPLNKSLDYGEIAVNYNVNEPFLSIKTHAESIFDGEEYSYDTDSRLFLV